MADTSNDREVKGDTEILNLEDDETTETDDDDLDEVVIPPVDEDETDPAAPEAEPEEPEPSPDSSPEGADPEAEPEAPSQPAPVPGETPKEKALRLEVQRVKGLLRQKGIQDLLTPGADQPPAVSERLAKLRETYTDEEITAMEEAVDAIAESRGYVKKSHNYQETVNTVVKGFITANPQYAPENDPEDVRWNRFQEILADGIYNIQGKTPEQLEAIFKKVDADVSEELGAPAIVDKSRKQAAERQKIRSVSHAGGTRTPAAPKEATIDPNVRSMFKDFDDEDLQGD